MFHLIVLSTSVALRPKAGVQLLKTSNDYGRLVTECLTMVACLIAMITQMQEIRFLGFYFSFANLVSVCILYSLQQGNLAFRPNRVSCTVYCTVNCTVYCTVYCTILVNHIVFILLQGIIDPTGTKTFAKLLLELKLTPVGC